MTPDAIHEHEWKVTEQAVHAWVAHFYDTEQDWDEPTGTLEEAVLAVLAKSQAVENDLITELQAAHLALRNAEIEIARLRRQRACLWAGVAAWVVVCGVLGWTLWGRI